MAATTVPEMHARRALAPASVVGGIGGLLFTATVVAQNLLRASLPAADAPTAKIVSYYASHRGQTAVLCVLFVLGAVAIATFAGALLTQLLQTRERAASLAGGLGVAMIMTLFPAVVAADIALSAFVHRGAPEPGTVAGLWVLHNALFGMLTVAIAIALAGLSAASAATGLLPSAWKPIGAVGALLLAIAGAATPAVLDGNAIGAVGLLGFVVWLAFVATASVKLLRQPAGS